MSRTSFKWHMLPELLNDPSMVKLHEPISSPNNPAHQDVWGCIEYPDGTIYEGWCLQGNPDGHGICYYDSGDIYVGQFSKGCVNGEGTVFFQCGDFFAGEFRDGSIYKGLYRRSGCEVWGTWEDGCCIEERSVAVSEGLQQKHAALLSAILYYVHHHFSNYRVQVPQPKDPVDVNSKPKTLQPILPIAHTGAARPPWSNSFVLTSPLLSHVNARNECSNIALDSGTLRNVTPNISCLPVCKGITFKKACEHCVEGEHGDGQDVNLGSTVMTQCLPLNVIFSCSAPACNEYFSFRRFMLRCFVFLVPFFSFHWFPFAPMRVSTVDQEREFVVSGATLRRDFDSMNLTINCIAVAVCCQIVSIVIVACKAPIGHINEGRITLIEMAVPLVLWLVLAVFCAGYNSYFRYPHFLERMDRQLTPKLSAFAANVVDARARVCISTWDEEGRGKVINRHYLYRWMFFSVVCGVIFSLAAPLTRAAYGFPLYSHGYTMCALVLSSFSIFLFTTTLLYYVFKITDTQREIAVKLRVLSDLAYIENRAIIRPNVYLRQTFDMGTRLDTRDLFSGFSGWYTTRSLILYGSSYSNHLSRSTAMSVFVTVLLIFSIISVSDAAYIYINYPDGAPNFHAIVHSYGILVFVIWGIQLTRYINACACTQRELKHHQYIMSLTSMYHRVGHRDVEACEIIKQSCEMASAHDLEPQWFNFPMYPVSMFILVLLNTAALIASILIMIREVRQ